MESVSNSAVAFKHNIVCYRGDTFTRSFRFFQDAENTIPLTLTGSTYKMQVRELKTQTVILEFTSESGIAVSDTNKLDLNKTAEQMVLKSGSYIYDLEKKTGDDVITIMKGTFCIEDDSTK